MISDSTDVKTDLCLSCSYMLKADFLLTWPNMKTKSYFPASLQLEALFSEDLCCAHTFCFNGYFGHAD